MDIRVEHIDMNGQLSKLVGGVKVSLRQGQFGQSFSWGGIVAFDLDERLQCGATSLGSTSQLGRGSGPFPPVAFIGKVLLAVFAQ